jgi:23S rRNA (uracil1939-C5)-methyltransferase
LSTIGFDLITMRPKKGEIITLNITDLAFGGNGVAKIENFVVFVESAVPGDVVEAQVQKSRGNYAEARIVRLITPSEHRVAPACEHFGYCGGCKWQHLEYAIQKQYKEDQVRQALIHIGGIKEPPVEPIIGAHKIYFYRNKMEFSFHVSEGGETLLGLHVAGRFQDIFQLNRCHLESEVSNEIVRFVRTRSVELGLPPYHIIDHTGCLRFLVIREGKFSGQMLVNLVTGKGDFPALNTLANEIGQKFSTVVSISHTVNPEKANIARGEKETVLYGSDHIYEQLGEHRYRISANSFFQTNSYQVQRLYDLAVELAQPEKLDRMLDLYTGTGTIAIYFSDLVSEVVGVESVADAIADAEANVELNSVTNCRFVVADVADYLKQAAGENFDLVVLDPPRAGCHPDVIKSLRELRPKKIVYISCNPATLARDVKELVDDGYTLDRAVPVDLFPHTFHIEAACRLTLRG